MSIPSTLNPTLIAIHVALGQDKHIRILISIRSDEKK